MRKSLGLVSALALIGGLAASTTGPHGTLGGGISRILTPAAQAASVEHPAAINASTGNYAVIAPTFLGATGQPFSSIRLFSAVGAAGSTTTSRFSATVVGVPSGQVYGSPVTYSIPHLASISIGINQIVKAAGVGYQSFTNGDTGYAVYLQDADPEAGFQHVVYNGTTQLFENMSNCATPLNAQMIALHNEMVLVNVHTSVGPSHLGTNYPSTMVIYNYYNAPTTYIVSVFNTGGLLINTNANASPTAVTADAGKLTCQLSFTVQANSSRPIAFSEIEQNAACRFDADEDYANVVIAAQTGGPPNAVLTHMIHVSLYNGDTNVSDVCAVNSVTSGAAGGAGGGGGVITSPYL